MEDRAVTGNKVPGVTIFPRVVCPAWPANRDVPHRRKLETPAGPVTLEPPPFLASDSGGPWPPSHTLPRLLDTPVFMSTERLLVGSGSCPPGLCLVPVARCLCILGSFLVLIGQPYIFFWEMSVPVFHPFFDWVVCLLLIELLEFFVNSEYKAPTGHVFCQDFLPVACLSPHFLMASLSLRFEVHKF